MTTGGKAGYNLDKARGLMWLISLIKNEYVNFFRYDTDEGVKLGLIDDFLSLAEDKQRTRFSSDVYTIIRVSSSPQPDDFTSVCCYGVHYFYGAKLREYPRINYLRNSNIQELDMKLIAEIEGDFDNLSTLASQTLAL